MNKKLKTLAVVVPYLFLCLVVVAFCNGAISIDNKGDLAPSKEAKIVLPAVSEEIEEDEWGPPIPPILGPPIPAQTGKRAPSQNWFDRMQLIDELIESLDKMKIEMRKGEEDA